MLQFSPWLSMFFRLLWAAVLSVEGGGSVMRAISVSPTRSGVSNCNSHLDIPLRKRYTFKSFDKYGEKLILYALL